MEQWQANQLAGIGKLQQWIPFMQYLTELVPPTGLISELFTQCVKKIPCSLRNILQPLCYGPI